MKKHIALTGVVLACFVFVTYVGYVYFRAPENDGSSVRPSTVTNTTSVPKIVVPDKKPTPDERANILHDVKIQNHVVGLQGRLEQQFDGRRYPATLLDLQALDGREIDFMEDLRYETKKNGLHYRLCAKLYASIDSSWCVTSGGYEE